MIFVVFKLGVAFNNNQKQNVFKDMVYGRKFVAPIKNLSLSTIWAITH